MKKTKFELFLKAIEKSKIWNETELYFKHSVNSEHFENNFEVASEQLLGEGYTQGLRIFSPLRAVGFMNFAFHSGGLHKIADDFSEVLKDVKLSVSSRYLKHMDIPVLIEIPEHLGFKFGNGNPVAFCAILCRRGKFYSDMAKAEGDCHIEIFSYGISGQYFRNSLLFLGEGDVVDSAIDRQVLVTPDSLKNQENCVGKDLLKFIINTLLYIQSGNPDLREYMPPLKPKSAKIKVLRRYERDIQSLSSIPVTCVGFTWLKDRRKSDSEITVRGHFQGYWTGVGRLNLEIKYKDTYVKNIP